MLWIYFWNFHPSFFADLFVWKKLIDWLDELLSKNKNFYSKTDFGGKEKRPKMGNGGCEAQNNHLFAFNLSNWWIHNKGETKQL